MTVRNYRGGKTRRRDQHSQPDIPVPDAPLQHDEVLRVSAKSALPILEQYRKTAQQGTNRKRLHRHRQRVEVWQLWCSGRAPSAIAANLNLDLMTVNKHLAYFRDHLEQGLRAIPMITGAELILHYQNIYHEAMAAWERSKTPQLRSHRDVTSRTTNGPDGTETQDTTVDGLRSTNRDGDPRFLERAQVALDRIALIESQIRPGSITPMRAADATTDAAASVPRAQLYLPHNGRDEPDGAILDAIPEESHESGFQQTDGSIIVTPVVANDGAGMRPLPGS